MNVPILITVIILSLILSIIVYHITEKYKVQTVITEIIVIIISILLSWIKLDDNEIEYTSNTITTTVETLEHTEAQEASIETVTITQPSKTDDSTSHEITTTSETIQIETTTNIDESDVFIYSNVHKLTLNVGESKCITITSTMRDGLAVGTTNKSVSTATWVKPIEWDGDNIQIRIIAKGCGTARIKVYQKWNPDTYYDYIEVEVVEN